MGITTFQKAMMAGLFIAVAGCGSIEPFDMEQALQEPASDGYDRDVDSRGRTRQEEASLDASDVLTQNMLDGPTLDRYLIKNAELTVEVPDAGQASEAIGAAVREMDGYLSDLRQSSDYYGRRTYIITVRVPATAFDAAMTRLDALGVVHDQHITTQDVTEEFVDTEAKLRNLKRTEERLLDHLDRTAQLENILRIEQELTRVRAQIEQHEGRLRFLEHRVAFSTIRITLREPAKAEPITPAESFSTAQVASQATRSLLQFLQRFWARLIWVGVWAVVWVPALVVVIVGCRITVLIFRWIRGRTPHDRSPEAAPPTDS